MKVDDADSGAKAGEEGAPSTSKPKKQREPSSEKLSNLSRVTPAQLSYIVFPPESRFQPIRPVVVSPPTPARSQKKGAVQRSAGGGGILMLLDKTPGEPIEWIEPASGVLRNIPVVQADAGVAVAEADPPPPFEYPFGQEGK